MITLEYEPKHAAVARANIARAGLADAVEVRVGRALDTRELHGVRREADTGQGI
jgi:predicted O-methyltransferase YrrM